MQPNLQTPTVESYTLKIEQQLPTGTTLSVGYIGSHGYHELLSIDCKPAQRCRILTRHKWSRTPSTGLANPAVWNTTHWFSEGVSSYNGLEVDVNHRFSHGLQFRGVYTFSKALDDGDSMNTSVATNSPAFVANPLDPMADYGRASFDIRSSGVINATYDLPFGRGKSVAPWVNKLVGDWQISGIETLLTGLPFTPQLSYNPSNDGDTRNPVRPDWASSIHCVVCDSRRAYRVFQCRRIRAARPGTLWQRRTKRLAGAGPGDHGPVAGQKVRAHRTVQPAVPRGALQHLQPRQFQQAQSRRLLGGGTGRTDCKSAITHSRSNNLYLHEFAAGAIRPEAAMVRVETNGGAVAKW